MDRLFVGLVYLWAPVLMILNVVAFYEGMDVWLGWGFWASSAVLVVALILRGIGGLFVAVLAFVGMWKGWEWHGLVAFAVAFPLAAMLLVTMLGGGVVKLLSRRSTL